MEKKKIVISSITTAVLLVLVVASSYAYFAARIQSSGQTSTSVGAKTLDSVSFNTGSDISLVANQDNFAFGKGDLTGSTTASVTFTARNDAASSYTYMLGFSFNSTFEYTTNKFQDKNGNTVTSLFNEENYIPNLKYEVSLTDNTPDITCYYSYPGLEPALGVVFTAFHDKDKNTIFEFQSDDEVPFIEKLDNPIGIFNYKVHITRDESERKIDGDIKYVAYMPLMSNDYGDDYSTFCVDNKSEQANEVSTYRRIPELELTIKKNGEVWIDSLDITGISESAVMPLQTKEIANKFYKENYGSFRNKRDTEQIAAYFIYSCMKNYYPTFNSYFEENFGEKNGGYSAFKTALCNGNTSCESQVDERYNSCTSLLDEYYFPTISAEAGKTATDTWEAIVTFKNLDTDQSINLDKDFSGMFQISSFEEYE